jgi:hypothetical protein
VKADTSRSSFDKARHYRSVLRQQGRVDLDADWNEQQEILDHLRAETSADLVGSAGGPADGAGFALSVDGTDLRVSAGHYYVGGLLAENEQEISVWDQPDAPSGSPLIGLPDGADIEGPTPFDGRYLVYLDVWDLHRTALEDTAVREVALGGPDSTTRVKTVWQVKLLAVDGDADCTTEPPRWTELVTGPTGLLAARAEPAEDPTGPCIVPAGAGFRGLENQHYRVEIHDGGDFREATFKWARDNGATVASWVAGPDAEGAITVASPGRDSVTGFAAGMWVELIDDTRELFGQPGTLVRLTNVRGNRLTITPADGIDLADFPLRPRVRRWDSAGALSLDAGEWLPLEQGVQVQFADSDNYPTGSFWSVPARTNLTDILWPRAADGTPLDQPPRGIRHRFAKLGLVTFFQGQWVDPHDCRSLFPHLTQLMELRAVSGDGQTATPNNGSDPGEHEGLAEPIVAGVSNGSAPVAGATVRFTMVGSNGGLNGARDPQTVVTDADGLAAIQWDVDSVNAVQQVRAEVLDDGGQPFGLPAYFTASLLTAARTSYTPTGACPDLAQATNVQEAIDILCKRDVPNFPRIKGISWTHAGQMTFDPFIAGLRIDFDRPMVAPAGPAVGWFLVQIEYDRSDFEGDPTEIFVRRINADQVVFSPGRDSVTYRPRDPFVLSGVPRQPLVRVILKSHVLTDDQGNVLDGDFLRSQLPTGNRTAGGDFESWFTLIEPPIIG